MPVVATAGHVDHGKSTLIVALTGRDPDRWEEEKRRGLTIDLGFAWTVLPGGPEVGFVDVPGHERFIKNMLAGVDAVDATLFVVAADEGWMPQSEEHLAVLDLLGIDRGVVALTRADLVDDETLEIAELEVREHLEGTSLENAEVLAVAAPLGRGIAELATALARAVAAAPPRHGTRTRMWVDRAFSISGAGTVVTGTLVGGPIALGDTLVVWPPGSEVRVRGLQTHERSADRIEPGNRAAVNLAGVERTAVARGAMLGRPDDWRPTRRFLAQLRTVRGLTDEITDRSTFHLHAGSGSWPARLRLLDGPAFTGSGPGLVSVEEDLPLAAGDRFILRDVGRRAVVAGGIVLDPHPPRRAGTVATGLVDLAAATAPDDTATALLAIRGVDSLASLWADSGGGRPEAGLVVAGTAVAPAEAKRLTDEAGRLLAAHHERFPLRAGMPKPDLASRLGIEPWLVEALADRSDLLVDDGATLRSATFEADLGEDARRIRDRVLSDLADAGLAVPRRDQLDLEPELLHALVRRGDLVEVSGAYVYPPQTLRSLEGLLGTLPEGFTVAEFRDATGITRKHAVPLLEWLDAAGVTRRHGDGRTLRRLPSDGPASGDVPSR